MQPKTLAIRAGAAKVRMLVDGDRICLSVLGGKPFEPDSLEVWGDICSSGGRVLDIGAYTGLYTIAAALMGCQTISFEPLHANRLRFRKNVALNGIDARVNGEAISDQCGKANLAYNANIPLTSGASIVRQTSSKGNVKRSLVPTITIDSLELKKLTAMKIDVEHGESLVLAGAQETLRRLKPAILVEVLDGAGRAAVRATIPFYRVVRELDTRNWLMVPK